VTAKGAENLERELPVGDDTNWREALELWDDRLKDASAKRAAQLFTKIARNSKDDAAAWGWVARANYYLGDYASSRDAAKFFQKGTELGRNGIEIDGDQIGTLFWTSCCLGAYAETLNFVRRATMGPELLRHLGKVWEKQPTYYHRGVARFLGQAFVRQSGLVTKVLSVAMPDVGPELVLKELRAGAKSDPPFVLTYQTLAQLAWHEERDGKTVQEMREAIDSIDLDENPYLAPENHRDQARALEIVKKLG
jgi:hypothetical protein